MSFSSPLAARMRVRQRRYPVFKVPGRPSSGPALRAGLDRSRLKRASRYISDVPHASQQLFWNLQILMVNGFDQIELFAFPPVDGLF